MVLAYEDIKELLPHRPPMLLVEKVVDLVPDERIVGLKSVASADCIAGGGPGTKPHFPQALALEAVVQCGGLLALKSSRAPTQGEKAYFFLLGVEDCQFPQSAVPGDTLRLEVEMLRDKGSICRLKGKAHVDGRCVCEAVVTLAQPKAA